MFDWAPNTSLYLTKMNPCCCDNEKSQLFNNLLIKIQYSLGNLHIVAIIVPLIVD